ncbi:MAG: RadC family protein [Syntrophothermus sp.]
MKFSELPLDDRPREKMMIRGARSLSDAELIAILLRTGTREKSVLQLSQELLSRYKNLAVLSSLSMSALRFYKGIGDSKIATIAAAFEISRRVQMQSRYLSEKKISSPSDIGEMFIPLLRDEMKEHFMVVCLSSSNRIIRYETVSVGNLNSSIVHPREIFKVAIENNSANIIIIHNHPSGNPEPSNEDIAVTKKLIEAGKIMDIQVFDHIIIAGNRFLSFVEKRLI